ncbi:helix-turn-helix transcriptional regulator [Streptomyces sp. IBSBF 2435]|uniref:helix-turn-helix transcriptional regulator n=1 Tax=Streptomyces sp. IBSBF 2435 TaxID=2903531 RepID=UPI002FDB9F14
MTALLPSPQPVGLPRPAGREDGRQGQLIGRQAEMRAVIAALAAARAGRGSALFVTGEPGVGKTRLAAEAIAAAAGAGMVTSRGRVSTVGSAVPYRPLVEALLCLARAGLLPEQDQLGGYAPLLAGLLPEPGAAAGSPASPLLVAEAVLRLLAVVGRRGGCLLVLDDLHDADMETLEVVEYLLDNLAEQPAVLLITAGRESCAATDLAARARQRGAAAILPLRPLGPSDVRLLVAAELGVAPDGVSDALVDRVVAGGSGVPFVVKELVHDLTRPDPARRAPDDDRDRTLPVPDSVARSVRRRTERLGPGGRRTLGVAALLGQRFPLPVLRHAVGCDDRELFAVLRAGAASYLLEPDASDPQWYAFRHRLAAEAVLDGLAPGERAGYARRAAQALADLHPGLPGEWCARAADLRGHAGDSGEAVRLYCEAGRRAMAEGAVDRALTLLTRAHRLADAAVPPGLRAAVLEQLLHAVGCSARFDYVPELTAAVEALDDLDVPAARRAGLCARLADVAALAGRPAEALHQLDVARRLLGGSPADVHRAPVDAAAAHVEPHRLAPDRLHTAAGAARRAAEAARRAGLPDVECGALVQLGHLTAERDESAATEHLLRACALARQHRLPVQRVSAEARLALAAARRDGRWARVEQVRQDALRIGALPLAYETGYALALAQVGRAEFGPAGERIREALAGATRLRLGHALPMLRLAEAVRYAHQGRRAEMQEALAALAPLVDDAPGVRAMSYGLARAFCSLLEEDREAAEREFAQAVAYDTENPATGDFGKHGVILLLGVLARRVGAQHYAGVTAVSAAGTRWNRQFVGLAHAVLLGREGRAAEADAAAATALEAAAIHPMARHLCLRLIARPAHEDGWGDPVGWLREAEEYFHGADVPAVAGACRGLLRTMGAPVRQRRAGIEQVPLDLRRYGVTVREFEVARLLATRIGNKDIAGRLHISPRTVEKHVASLLRKTGHPDRGAFATAAGALTPALHAG